MKIEKDFEMQDFWRALNVICRSKKMKMEKDFILMSMRVIGDAEYFYRVLGIEVQLGTIKEKDW